MGRRKRDPLIPEVASPDGNVENKNLSVAASNTLIATPEEVFQRVVADIEDEIVLMFSHGASLSQITRKFPSYTAQDTANLVTERLKLESMPLQLMSGMQVHGYQDDLRQLTALIDDKSLQAKEKLLALKLRTDTRTQLVEFLQSQGVLATLNNGANSVPPIDTNGGSSPFSLTGAKNQNKTTREFNDLATPEERQRYIECLEKGVPYTTEIIDITPNSEKEDIIDG